jgi:flagellar hook-length control protein FliK
MQTLEVQQPQVRPANPKSAMGGKTGAETARNGSSFLAVIDRMIAGTMEGAGAHTGLARAKMAGRGAGGDEIVPGDENTLIKPGAGKKNAIAGIKKDAKVSSRGETARLRVPKQVLSAAGTSDAVLAEGLTAEAGDAIAKRASAGEARAAKKTPIAGDTGAEADAKKADEKTTEGAIADAAAMDGTDKSYLAAFTRHSAAHAGDSSATTATADAGKKPGDNDASDGIDIAAPVSAHVDRRDRKSFINVRDERTDAAAQVQNQSPLVKTTEITGDNQANMTIGFRTDGTAHSTAGETSKLSEKRDSDGQNFSSMLSQELKNNAADFVKTGQIVLKNNNEGLIRLTLHPESLGSVKISLELSGDRKISGKIVVSSQEAYDAFNENLDGLSDAFVQGGFESAGFDLSWSGSGSESFARGQEAREAAAISPFYASSIPDVMSGHESSDTQRSGYRSQAWSSINVFA